MYPGHPHHQPKRRKKRPIHGVKTVDVTRGKSGYGFTISGQQPCVLSCIVANSPAEKMGLRPGDYLISVNAIDVSKMGHDEVVRMVGMSTGTLTIQVAENYNSSDSSDDEYVHRAKAKYPTRMKQRQRSYGEKMERILADINHRDRHCPDGHSHDPNSRPISKNGDGKPEVPKSRSSRPRLHMPVGAENHEIDAAGMSYIEAGASNVFKVPFTKSMSASHVPSSATNLPKPHRVEPKQAFIKSTSQSHVKSLPTSNALGAAAAAGPNPGIGPRGAHGHTYEHFSPNSLQQIINHSLHSYSAANEAFILQEDEFDDDGEDDPLQPDGEVRIVVGYIGSLEMPGDVNQPHIRIQSIRNAVRRLRVEQKIHTLVLMIVLPAVGVKLINMAGKEIAYYPIDRLAFSGVCPDDRRFFGIVTFHQVNKESSSDSEETETTVGSSCHVFMVDQELTAHNIHAQKARSFGIECTVDPTTQRCLEFPRSTTPIIISISNLYKDRPGGSIENDVTRSQVFANPNNRPVEHVRTSSSSSNNSNSDSGLGLCRDDNSADRAALVVEMQPPPPPPPLPARERPPQQQAPPQQQQQPQQLPQIQWSGNTVYLTDGPVKRLSHSDSERLPSSTRLRSASERLPKGQSLRGTTQSSNERDPHTSLPDTSTSSEDIVPATDKLTIRAMPDPTPKKQSNRLSGDGLENQNDAENLRLGMQKLLQARQKQSTHDQISSDSESRSSRGESSISNSASQLRERPVSAPFNYLSAVSSSDLKAVKSELSKLKNDSDSSLTDKLSPRAFLSSAFTPVGSVSSAFKKVRSRPRLQELRSPSAPPIPSYHGDDEDSEEEDVRGIIKRMQREKALGVSVGGSEPRKRASGHLHSKKRDQERRGGVPGLATPELPTKSSTNNTTSANDKWTTKGGAGSLRKKSTRGRNPLSLSHESLVVFEQDAALQQKLTSANSVNSIVNHVAKATAIENEEVGRVSGWAVAFDKLLRDPVGVEVFTDFLKGEFSEENMVFWKTCEDFKRIVDSNYRKSKAKEIYDQYISVRAQDAVNIDSVARKEVERQLDSPLPQMFDIAQQHIFQLMKQDSYARFLKSDLYKSYLMREMEGQPIVSPRAGDGSGGKGADGKKGGEKDKKKGSKGKENSEENKERRRRSLLPWRTKSKKGSKGDNDGKSGKQNKDNKEVAENNALPTKNNNNSSDLNMNHNIKKENAIVEVPETIAEEPVEAPPRFCRVIMPDGSTTVVGTKQGQTINYVLGKLLEKRNTSIATVDVFLLGSEKPLNLNDDITTLGSKEVTIERRVLFRMDLPNKKSIGVKAKPNRRICDVFKPILHKYGYRMESIDVHLCGQSDVALNLDSLVSTIDSQRVMVFTQSAETPPAPRNGLFGKITTASRPPLPNNHLTRKHGFHGNHTNGSHPPVTNYNNNNNNGIHHHHSSLDDVTNQIYGSVMLDKADQLLLAHNFDELGILDPESGAKLATGDVRHSLDSSARRRDGTAAILTKDSGRSGRSKPKVTFSLPKSSPSEAEEDLCERLKRAQNLSLDDQRGPAPRHLELPDFLREDPNLLVGRESAPAALNSRRRGSGSSNNRNGEDDDSEREDSERAESESSEDQDQDQHQQRDLISEIDDYIENITENFAAYTRESTPNRLSGVKDAGEQRAVQNFRTFGTPKLKCIDKSFSEDGIVPTYEEAESLFQGGLNDGIDFDDPTLIENDLSDLGLNSGYTKYLSKSRNFVNQRPKPVTPVVIQTDKQGPQVDVFSPNRTLSGDINPSDLLDATLIQSPSSSPYESDSSIEKENLYRLAKSNVKNVQVNSRHTKLHSPITATEENGSLSLVDTDGGTRHTTHANITLAGAQPAPVNKPTSALTHSVGINNKSHTDEVTFV